MARWHEVCSTSDLLPQAGVCVLVEGKQIAIFYLAQEAKVYALDNYDPFSQANVISRGLVGDINGEVMVASPLYKQHFSLQTGACFEDVGVQLNTYAVRMVDKRVEICLGAVSEKV